jgi:predicted enzyme related to lactoylglutathione lyase
MTHKSRLSALVIDSQVEDIEEANLFWSQALGYACTAEEDSADKYADLQTPSGQLDILVQKVEHPSRVHLDIETDDKEAEVARLVALGAREVERFPSWIVMEAPTGHRFCVVNPQRADFHTSAEVNEWP